MGYYRHRLGVLSGRWDLTEVGAAAWSKGLGTVDDVPDTEGGRSDGGGRGRAKCAWLERWV